MTPETLKSTPEQKVEQNPVVPENQQSPEVKKIKDNTKIEIKNLKADMSFESFKSFLEGLKEELQLEQKQILLGSLLSVLNAKGYSIKLVQNGGIEVFGENMDVFKGDEIKELNKYDTLLKSALKNSLITIDDIKQAILSKSMAVNSLQKGLVFDRKMNTTEYFMGILKKHGLKLQVDTKEADIGEYLKQLKFTDYKEFERFKNSQLSKITDISDREFVRAYLDGLYYSDGKRGYKEDDLSKIETQVDKNKEEIKSIIGELDPKIQVKLGLQKESIQDRFSRDAMGALQEGAMNGGIKYAVVFGILGKLFGGIFGIKHMGTLGLGLGFLIGGGQALGREGKDMKKLVSDFLSDKKDNKETTQQSTNTQSNTQANSVDTQTNQNNSIYNRYDFLFKGNNTEEQEKLKIWGELSRNDKFLNSPSSFLEIFNTNPTKPFSEISTEFKKYGIDLTESNKNIYKNIFNSILVKRKSDGISILQQNETIKQFLEKTSNTNNTVSSGLLTGNTVNNLSESTENSHFTKIGYIKDGKNYIIGPDGNPTLFNINMLTQSEIDTLKGKEQDLKKLNNLFILAQAMGDDNSIITIRDKIDSLMSLKDYGIVDNYINNSFIINKKIPKGIIDFEKTESVLNYIRDELGNSGFVYNLLSNNLFDNNIDVKEFISYIDTKDNENIKKLFGEDYSNFKKDILKRRQEREKYILKNKSTLQQENPNIDLDTIKDQVIDNFTISYTKGKILEKQYDTQTFDKDKKPLEYLFSDITGFGNLSDSYVNISDKKMGFTVDIAKMVGLELRAIAAGAATMSAGFFAVNAAVWGRRSYEGIKALQLGDDAGKLAKIGRWGGMSAVEGGSFYAGYGGVQGMIEGKNMYSLEGLGESIAFAGAFRALRAIPGFQINPNIALSKQKLRITSLSAVDTAVLGAIGLGIDGIIFEPGEWTAEHLIQAFAMAIMFRGMSHAGEKNNLRFKQNGDTVEVSKNSVESNSSNKSSQESAQAPESSFRKQNLIKSLLPKKAGAEVTIGDKVIKKTPELKYIFDGKTYDKADDILLVLSQDLKDAQIIAKINEGGAKNINRLFNGVVNKEIQIGNDTFRFRTEGGKNILEIKNGSGWARKSIDELDESQAQILLDRILGTGVKDKILGGIKQKINNIKTEDVVSSSEKETIIKRFGTGAWEKIKAEIDHLKSDKSNWEKFKGLTLGWNKGTGKAVLGGVVLNEGWETYQAGGIDERYENLDITDGIDSIMNGILFRYVSFGRAIVYQAILEKTDKNFIKSTLGIDE